MKYHTWLDADGYRRRVLARDADSDSAAERIGIPADPPDLAGLDGLTDDARRDLHNALAGRGLYTWQDVVRLGNGITSTVAAVAVRYKLDRDALKREVVRLYKGR